jgi:hypothetical protein
MESGAEAMNLETRKSAFLKSAPFLTEVFEDFVAAGLCGDEALGATTFLVNGNDAVCSSMCDYAADVFKVSSAEVCGTELEKLYLLRASALIKPTVKDFFIVGIPPGYVGMTFAYSFSGDRERLAWLCHEVSRKLTVKQ